MQFRALTWNLFHGRDFPPDPRLFTWRSRLLGVAERNATHVQLNRDLASEFAELLSGAGWDLALLQECPPRWSELLARLCGAEAHRVLTSRNWLGRLRAALASRNPDLMGSWEGGSNLTLVRAGAGAVAERRELVLRPGPLPERRVMAFTRLTSGLCAANLHASGADRLAEEELRTAAAQALAWSGGEPVIFGGDLNLRPSSSSLYDELRERFDLSAPTAPDAIDHLLARGLDIAESPRRLAPERTELVEPDGLRLRLSDHRPVVARFVR